MTFEIWMRNVMSFPLASMKRVFLVDKSSSDRRHHKSRAQSESIANDDLTVCHSLSGTQKSVWIIIRVDDSPPPSSWALFWYSSITKILFFRHLKVTWISIHILIGTWEREMLSFCPPLEWKELQFTSDRETTLCDTNNNSPTAIQLWPFHIRKNRDSHPWKSNLPSKHSKLEPNSSKSNKNSDSYIRFHNKQKREAQSWV